MSSHVAATSSSILPAARLLAIQRRTTKPDQGQRGPWIPHDILSANAVVGGKC
jgi:hypothetical protein